MAALETTEQNEGKILKVIREKLQIWKTGKEKQHKHKCYLEEKTEKK